MKLKKISSRLKNKKQISIDQKLCLGFMFVVESLFKNIFRLWYLLWQKGNSREICFSAEYNLAWSVFKALVSMKYLFNCEFYVDFSLVFSIVPSQFSFFHILVCIVFLQHWKILNFKFYDYLIFKFLKIFFI